ncbi:hypothetical protein [Sanguibacter sp. Leaf3]|uniref:hypothetical protein n=1 Tax=Sanguibacter sp. Leaf3 TaxID=1736209 RepID=UPI0006F4C161|nr:hypothetical protein [Sanguibacter sp. Leaf3]KQT98380.1 hypothetical protein ASG53_12020 [Sanguibacter sp. Leaf3]
MTSKGQIVQAIRALGYDTRSIDTFALDELAKIVDGDATLAAAFEPPLTSADSIAEVPTYSLQILSTNVNLTRISESLKAAVWQLVATLIVNPDDATSSAAQAGATALPELIESVKRLPDDELEMVRRIARLSTGKLFRKSVRGKELRANYPDGKEEARRVLRSLVAKRIVEKVEPKSYRLVF